MAETDSKVEITKEKFLAYEKVRKSGKYNMFDPRAQTATGLTKDEYLDIIGNYDTYYYIYIEQGAE